MATENADDLVPFLSVTVIRSTTPALLCRIGEKSVCLSRVHISGKLWSVGDRGKLFIRRWVARDRHLIEPEETATASSSVSASPPRQPGRLHIVRGDPLPTSCR